MKKFPLIHLFLLNVILSLTIGCEKTIKLSDLQVSRAKTELRTSFYQNLVSEKIQGNLKQPLCTETEKNWMEALWAMELIGYRTPEILMILKQGFANFENRSAGFQRALLEAVYTLYPTEFQTEVNRIAGRTENPKLFAMAVCYLRRKQAAPGFYSTWLSRQFPDWQTHPILRSLALTDSVRPPLPPVQELLAHSFQSGKPVIYSLQRPNRDFPGLLLVKAANGRFLRNTDGSIFHIPQLARSLANLPGYLTNGNTPQGIHSFSGFLVSENVFIGPTPTLQMVLPFEANLEQFFHGENAEENWFKLYQEMLPASWQNYPPVYEAYFAGKAGRTEIIAHGSTVNPEFYRETPFYPFTPSLGCLTALELWSETDGRCLVSGQRQLVNTLQKHGIDSGYFVVVEIENRSAPVSFSEIVVDLLIAEAE